MRPDQRFIPADAGNRPAQSLVSPQSAVHPRGRGEQLRLFDTPLFVVGSSPRTRGTGSRVVSQLAGQRFIPADAGNSIENDMDFWESTVHPRGRGEQPWHGHAVHVADGSSPRTRGTAADFISLYKERRFIPADAGNSWASRRRFANSSVHPRGRGEQSRYLPKNVEWCGSSPRTRGTGEVGCWPDGRGRFIPADAGNRSISLNGVTSTPVHPRGRGEQRQ